MTSRFSHVWREAAIAVLAGALALIAVLGCWSTLPDGVVSHLLKGVSRISIEAITRVRVVEIAFALLWSILTPLLWLLLRRIRTRSVWSGLATASATTIAYLGWDAAATTPLPALEQLVPPPAHAAESAAAARQVPETDPAVSQWLHSWKDKDLGDYRAWRVFVAARREALRADWLSATAHREWLEKMDTYDGIGDEWRHRQTSKIKFRALYDLALFHCAYATLLAMDGQGDEALALTQRLMSVGRKLQVSARSMFPYLCGSVLRSRAQQTAAGILHFGDVRRESMERFAVALERNSLPGVAAARIWQAELQTWALPGLRQEMTTYLLSRHLGPLQRMFYLPQATENMVIARYSELARVVEEGRGEESRVFEHNLYHATFKNSLGAMMLALTIPTFDNEIRLSWRVEDHRRALLADVRARLAEMEKREVEKKGVP